MAEINKIKILDTIYDITVPALEEKIADLVHRLEMVEAKNEDVYYQGSYTAIREAVIDIIERLESIERINICHCSICGALYAF